MRKLLLTLPFFLSGFLMLNAQTQRMVLYEGFSNASCPPCATQNPTNNSLINSNPDKVVAIKYQTNWPGFDPMNAQTQTMVAPRVSYYSITGVPSTRLDGQDLSFNQTNINNRYAVASPFFLEISHNFNTAYDSVTVQCIITAAQNFTGANMFLHIGMIENHIGFATAPGSTNEKDFYRVMRKMVPNSTGTPVKDNWVDGESDTITFTTSVPTYIYDLKELSFVAFIQSNTNKAVHQAAKNAPEAINLYPKISGHNIPSEPVCTQGIALELVVQNKGSVEITSLEFMFGEEGEMPQTHAWTGSIAVNGQTTITLPSFNFATNAPTVYARITETNGLFDYPKLHAYIEGNVNTLGQYAPLPLVENFTATAFPPANWTSVSYDDAAKWQRAAPGGFGQTPGGSARMDFWSSPSGQIDLLYIHGLDFSGMDSVQMTFSVAYARYSASYSDALRVQISTNCGDNWTNIYNKAGSTLATAPDNTSSFSPTASQWRKETLNLNTYAGQSDVLIRFYALSGYGNNLYVDDINIDVPTASVQNVDAISFINIYPNPASDVLHFELQLEESSELHIQLFDMMGRVVASKFIEKQGQSGFSASLNISDISEGIYQAVITTEKGVFSKKVVKN